MKVDNRAGTTECSDERYAGIINDLGCQDHTKHYCVVEPIMDDYGDESPPADIMVTTQESTNHHMHPHHQVHHGLSSDDCTSRILGLTQGNESLHCQPTTVIVGDRGSICHTINSSVPQSTMHPLHTSSTASSTLLNSSSLRSGSSSNGSEIELARRLGVRFDSSNAAWVARWVDPHTEKKKSRWFSVAKYGELSARRLAIQACLQNIKASDYSNFRDLQDVLASFAATSPVQQGGTPSSVLVPTSGDTSSSHGSALFAPHNLIAAPNGPHELMMGNSFIDSSGYGNKLASPSPHFLHHSPLLQHHPFAACVPPMSNYIAAAAAAAMATFPASLLNLSQQQQQQLLPQAGVMICEGVPQEQAVIGVVCSENTNDTLSCGSNQRSTGMDSVVKAEDRDEDTDTSEDGSDHPHSDTQQQQTALNSGVLNGSWQTQQPSMVLQDDLSTQLLGASTTNLTHGAQQQQVTTTTNYLINEPSAMTTPSDISTTASSSFSGVYTQNSSNATTGLNTLDDYDKSLKLQQQSVNAAIDLQSNSLYATTNSHHSASPDLLTGGTTYNAGCSNDTTADGYMAASLHDGGGGGFSSLSSSEIGTRSEDDEEDEERYVYQENGTKMEESDRKHKKRKIDYTLDVSTSFDNNPNDCNMEQQSDLLRQSLSFYNMYNNNMIGNNSNNSSQPSSTALAINNPLSFHPSASYYQMYHPSFTEQTSTNTGGGGATTASNNSAFSYLSGNSPYQIPLVHPSSMHPGFLSPQHLDMTGRFYFSSNPLHYHQFAELMSLPTADSPPGSSYSQAGSHGGGYKRLTPGGCHPNSSSVGSPSSGGGTGSFSHHGLSAKMTCERGLHYSKCYRGNQECWIAVWNTKGGRIMHEAFDVTIMGFEQAKSKAREARDAAHSNNLVVAENSRPSWKSHSNTGIPHVSLDSQQLRFRAHKFGRRLCRSFSFGRRRGSFASRESAFDAAVLWLIQTPTEEEIATVSGVSSKIEEPM